MADSATVRRSWSIGLDQRHLSDFMAGAIVSAVPIAYCLSFSAIMCQGEMSLGLPIVLWSFLCGTLVSTVAIGAMTSMPPIVVGTDPTSMAMMTVVTTGVASAVKAAGGSSLNAVTSALAATTVTTGLIGILMLAIGGFRLGRSLRFVPSGVIGGFLGATGVLLVLASFRLVTGDAYPWTPEGLANLEWPKLLVAIGFLCTVLAARRWIKSPLLLPMMIFGASAAIDLLLVSDRTAGFLQTWYLSNMGTLVPWVPGLAAAGEMVDWSAVVHAYPDMIATALVCLISLVVRTSALEVALSKQADFDQEAIAHGVGNLAAFAFGGMTAAVVSGGTRLMLDLGAKGRLATMTIALLIAILLVTGVNLPALVPLPVLAGLLWIVGYGLVFDGLVKPLRQGAWMDGALAVLITAICLQYGFLAAVVIGFIASCLLFAVSYSRIGVIRRHLTRQVFSGQVEHTVEVERQLREHGDAIHIYWLSGYIFFGSSDRVFEDIRSGIETQSRRPLEFLILDLASVTGADTAAVMSFAKIKSVCDKRNIVMVYSGPSAELRRMLGQAGCVGGAGGHTVLADHGAALAWCEERLLSRAGIDRPLAAGFESWLASQLGVERNTSGLSGYFERKGYPAGSIIYNQSSPADTIDIIADGIVSIVVDAPGGKRRVLRQMARRTVVGEMGFFRGQMRAATVLAEQQVEIFSLTRPAYERMLKEDAELAAAFLVFIIRTLSDRLEFANAEIAALA